MSEISAWGVVVSPGQVKGRNCYAELVPATPYIIPKPKGQKWRYYRVFGRSWKEPHIRWWFEVFGDDKHGQSCHYTEHDGGALTFRGAVAKAMEAVSRVAEEIENE